MRYGANKRKQKAPCLGLIRCLASRQHTTGQKRHDWSTRGQVRMDATLRVTLTASL